MCNRVENDVIVTAAPRLRGVVSDQRGRAAARAGWCGNRRKKWRTYSIFSVQFSSTREFLIAEFGRVLLRL